MKIITETHNQSKCRLAASSPNGYLYKRAPAFKAQGTLWKRVQKKESGSNIRSYTYKVSPTQMSKHQLIKNTNRHSKMEREDDEASALYKEPQVNKECEEWEK